MIVSEESAPSAGADLFFQSSFFLDFLQKRNGQFFGDRYVPVLFVRFRLNSTLNTEVLNVPDVTL